MGCVKAPFGGCAKGSLQQKRGFSPSSLRPFSLAKTEKNLQATETWMVEKMNTDQNDGSQS